MTIRSLVCAGGAALLLAAPCLSRADDAIAQRKAFIEKTAPSIVTVDLVLKSSVKDADNPESSETRMNIKGVVVSPGGLVMLSNVPFSPARLMQTLGMSTHQSESVPKYTPTSIKVTVDREEKQYSAFLAASDTTTDLAFVQMEGLGDRKLTSVDFSNTADVQIGEEVSTLTRMAKGYDYAPILLTSMVNGEITRPRHAWTLGRGISELGLPVYNAAGVVVGVLSTVPPGGRESGDDNAGFSAAMRMFSGSGFGTTFVFPGNSVKAVIDLAAKRAADLAVQRAATPPPAVKPAPKPAK